MAGVSSREVVRRDSKIRLLGDRSYVGDQEVIGKFDIYDDDENLIFEFDPDAGTITAYDTSGNVVWSIDTSGGTITDGYSWGDTAHRVDAGPRQWTTNNTWTDINQSIFEIDGDSFQNVNVFFEALICVEVAGRTVSCRIYNTTDGNAVTNSEVSSTAVSAEVDGWMDAEVVRGASAITFPSGTKEYKMQFKQSVAGSAGDSAQFFRGSLVYQAI